MRIDAHQHFWDVNRFSVSVDAAGESPLHHTYLPRQLNKS